MDYNVSNISIEKSDKKKPILKRILGILSILLFIMFSMFIVKYVIENVLFKPGVSFSSSKGIFPSEWRQDPINAVAKPISITKRASALSTVKRAYKKYPSSFLDKTIRKVYLLGDLNCYNTNYGATSTYDTIYLVYFWPDASELLFHHEISHVLRLKYKEYLDEIAFTSFNSKGFSYGDNAIEAINSGKSSTDVTEEYAKDGFLHQYAMTGVCEDVASFSESLFMGNKTFWKLYDENPKIKSKADIVISFYHKIDSTFTKDYFKKFQSGNP